MLECSSSSFSLLPPTQTMETGREPIIATDYSCPLLPFQLTTELFYYHLLIPYLDPGVKRLLCMTCSTAHTRQPSLCKKTLLPNEDWWLKKCRHGWCDYDALIGSLDFKISAHFNDYSFTTKTCENAARGGHLGSLKFLDTKQCKFNEKIFIKAASNGHLQILTSFYDKYHHLPCFKRRSISEAAIKGNHLNVLKWSQQKNVNHRLLYDDDFIFACAALYGRLAILQWLEQDYIHREEKHLSESVGATNICRKAAEGGHLYVLRWVREKGCDWDAWTCENAAKGGHLDVLTWAKKNECPWDARTCEAAAKGGHLDVLTWARANGCPWNARTCQAAAGEGHLDILIWARENGCDWDERTCEAAAEGGHLDVLKWARKHGCDWYASMCEAAARGGNLEVLKWVRKKECYWDERTCQAAAAEGHLHILKWARKNLCPWDAWTCQAAAEGGHLDVLKWLRKHECPWDAWTCQAAAEGGHLHVLKWARKHGCPWNAMTCEAAAKGGYLDVLE